jgi:hypothetical protein
MITTQQELFKAFESLPAEAQRQALNFIAFLQQTYAPVTFSPNIAVKSSDINAQHQKLTLNDLISTIPNNFTYPDDVMEFTESEPLGRELLMNIQRGEIIRINLNPTQGREQAGNARPCLVISHTQYNQKRQGIVIVHPITSTIKSEIKMMIPIPAGFKV